MSSDNRTLLNDCDGNTGWDGDDSAPSVANNTGEFYQGTAGLSWQASDADEHSFTTEDSVGGGAFSLDFSDSTLYMLIKDNLQSTFALGGIKYVVGDTTNRVGYDVGGNDATGLPALGAYFNAYKLDLSVLFEDESPETGFTAFLGSEGALVKTAITQVGYGCLHLAKANGPSDNAFMDAFYYIANDLYALTIDEGSAGTPIGMSDVVAEDVTDGRGLVSNPIGDAFFFFGPTEWAPGAESPTADNYFLAENEQWFWIGDNGGGHAVGPTHFPFRVIGEPGSTSSFKLQGVSITNTGTGAQFDLSDANVDIAELDGCTLGGLASLAGPASGSASRFLTSTIFVDCGPVTANGCSMIGNSYLEPDLGSNDAALIWDLDQDPDGELDESTFTHATDAESPSGFHHAIRFGPNTPAVITLRDMDFSGFSTSDDHPGSVFEFTSSESPTVTYTVNLVGCTHDGSGFTVDARNGAIVNIVIDPVTTTIAVVDEDGADLQNARVYLAAADGTGDLPFNASVTITRAGTVATVAHTGHGLATGNDVKILGITDKTEDNNGTHQITVVDDDEYTYTTTDDGSVSYTGTITSTGVVFNDLTDVNGEVNDTRTFSVDQPLTGRVRISTTTPRYKTFPLTLTVLSASGASINVMLARDD